MKKILIVLSAAVSLGFIFSGCSEKSSGKIELDVFVAASLNKVMSEISAEYEKSHPGTRILLNADGSGTLMTQIREGCACDIFFSAGQKQMDILEKEGFLVESSRKNVLNNQLVVLTCNGSGTKVTGLENLESASSMALAGDSVPAGNYTRAALEKLGSKALEKIEVSEQSNVSKVLNAVAEGACEVGTTYYSDIHGREDKVEVLQFVPHSLTGDIIYPMARIKNPEASDAKKKAAGDFMDYVLDSKDIFRKYYFDPDL